MISDEELMKIARKQAKDKAGFYVHFACYVMVNIGLFIFFWNQNPELIIPIMFGPLFGWGIGIIAHFVSIYAGASPQNIQKEFKKLKEQTK
jgi:hypothetical protein